MLSTYVRADAAEASVLLLTGERGSLVMSSGEVAVLFYRRACVNNMRCGPSIRALFLKQLRLTPDLMHDLLRLLL